MYVKLQQVEFFEAPTDIFTSTVLTTSHCVMFLHAVLVCLCEIDFVNLGLRPYCY